MTTFLPDPRVGRFERLVTAGEAHEPGDDTRRFGARAPLPSTVEEHCQECAAPDCYAACPLYVSDSRVGCRRLRGGIGWGVHPSGTERIHVDLAPLARLKFKVRLDPDSMWRHAFLLQFASKRAAPNGSVVVQISRSPWRPAAHGITVSAPVQEGWNELLVNAHQLSFLQGEELGEASVLFTDHAGRIEVATAHFVQGIEARDDSPGSRASPRVLFTDLDGTLWTGAAGEGPIGPRADARRALEQLRDLGIEIVAVTRSTTSAASAALAAATLEVLVSEVTVVDPRSSKADVLANWLAAHGRGVDEAIFADDDPAERWEARRRLPGLLVLDERELCAGPLHPAVAARSGPTRRRTGAARSQDDPPLAVAEETLRPRAELAVASTADYPRLWELLLRTNRYNCAVWRPDFAEFVELAERHDVTVWRGNCADDLVDYGIVCAAVVEHPATIRALTFSCRIGHRRFPWLFLDQLRRRLPQVPVTWAVDPAPRADALVSAMREELDLV